MDFEFPHIAPEGCYYETQQFKSNVISIWLCNNRKFDYNLGEPTKTIWGFWSSKKRAYYAPINSKTMGNVVDIQDTRNYTAMQIKQTPLEKCFS